MAAPKVDLFSVAMNAWTLYVSGTWEYNLLFPYESLACMLNIETLPVVPSDRPCPNAVEKAGLAVLGSTERRNGDPAIGCPIAVVIVMS